jgi:hypothetical protein
VWTLRIVVAAPVFDDNLGLLQRVEDLTVEQFIAKFAVEALAMAILPRTSRFDVSGPGPDCGDPIPKRLGDELRAIV